MNITYILKRIIKKKMIKKKNRVRNNIITYNTLRCLRSVISRRLINFQHDDDAVKWDKNNL